MDIENKTIIITGAARGLGAAMAKRLATHKCKLGLIDLEQESMNVTKEACEAVGAEVMTYAGDVTKEEDVASTYRQIVAELGIGPDVTYFSPDDGILVVEFVEGKAVSAEDARQPAPLQRIVAAIRPYHDGPEFPIARISELDWEPI